MVKREGAEDDDEVDDEGGGDSGGVVCVWLHVVVASKIGAKALNLPTSTILSQFEGNSIGS